MWSLVSLFLNGVVTHCFLYFFQIWFVVVSPSWSLKCFVMSLLCGSKRVHKFNLFCCPYQLGLKRWSPHSHGRRIYVWVEAGTDVGRLTPFQNSCGNSVDLTRSQLISIRWQHPQHLSVMTVMTLNAQSALMLGNTTWNRHGGLWGDGG